MRGETPLAALWQGALSDVGRVPVVSLAARSVRRMRSLWLGRDLAQLLGLPIFNAHLQALGVQDRLFFLAQRHYLTRDFSLDERAAAAVWHYLGEATLGSSDYLSTVYDGDGLALWQDNRAGHSYEIRLTRGLDVAHEGALSVSLLADGERVGVMSFSIVPVWLVDRPTVADERDAVLITRKQLTRERGYQKPFFEAFDRSTPAHLLLAAIEGLVQARGGSRVFGVAAVCHPAFHPAISPFLNSAYNEFWESVGGTPVSQRAYAMPVPMQLRPVEDMQPDRRERALARRGHADAIREGARRVMVDQVRQPLPAASAAE